MTADEWEIDRLRGFAKAVLQYHSTAELRNRPFLLSHALAAGVVVADASAPNGLRVADKIARYAFEKGSLQ